MFQAIIASSMESVQLIADQLSIGRLLIDGAKANEELQRRRTLQMLTTAEQINFDFAKYIRERGNLPTFFWIADEEELEYARVGVVRNPSTECPTSTLSRNTLDRFVGDGVFAGNLVVVETPDREWFWYYHNRFGQTGSTILHARQDKLPLYRSLGKLNRS